MKKASRKNTILNFLAAERGALIAYVRRLIDDVAERDGEDIVQDVALSLFDRADITIPIENAAAYVYQALRNKVIDYLRKGRKTISLDEGWAEDEEITLMGFLTDPKGDGINEINRMEAHENLRDVLAVLSDEERYVITATELNGDTFQELADRSGVSLGTLLARKSRALHKLRQAISMNDKGGKNGSLQISERG
jgi:RNA polymerase sigma factor (sigma-70 family)